MLVLAYREVGNEKSVIMTEETLDDIDIDFKSSTFPFHNLIKLGTQATTKQNVGAKMWSENSNSQTLSNYLATVTETQIQEYLCKKIEISLENYSQKNLG